MASKKKIAVTPIMRKSEYARYRGVSDSTIYHWERRGLMVLTDTNLVRVPETDAKLVGVVSRKGGVAHGTPEYFQRMAKRHQNDLVKDASGSSADDIDDGSMTLSVSAGVKEEALARTRRLEYEERAAQLVRAEDVKVRLQAHFSAIRERILAIPGKLAPSLVDRSRGDIETIFRREVFEVLEALSHGGP